VIAATAIAAMTIAANASAQPANHEHSPPQDQHPQDQHPHDQHEHDQHEHEQPPNQQPDQPEHDMAMEHGAMATTLDIPDTRDASGTSWQPDSTPMFMWHWMTGGWSLGLHTNVFAGVGCPVTVKPARGTARCEQFPVPLDRRQSRQ
jgi:hypothetical protein